MKTIKDCVYNLNITEFCNASKKNLVCKKTHLVATSMALDMEFDTHSTIQGKTSQLFSSRSMIS